MEQSISNRLMTFAACALWFASAATIYAAPAVTYLDWDGAKKEMVTRTVTDYEVVTAETRTLENGKWYVVAGQITIDNGDHIAVADNGAAHLVLCDGASLTITNVGSYCAGIDVSSAELLVIHGQQNGTGVLTATGGPAAAGIGGGSNGAVGEVIILGGMVTATGGVRGAGIGGGLNGAGGWVEIFGGTVTANGGVYGAGIGGGDSGAGGTVNINGGRVTAVGDGGGKGIGGGNGKGGGSVNITGGTVSASGWNGIGPAKIDGGNVKAVSTNGHAPFDPQPTNAMHTNVYCVTVTLGENARSEGASIAGLTDYGTGGVYPLDGNKLYLYLPNGDYSFSVNGRMYRAIVHNAGVRAMLTRHQPTDVLPFDGVLVQDGRPLGDTNATALVRVDGADYEVAIRTDAAGRFATNLPKVIPESEAVFVRAKVGGRTIEVNRPLTVPQLPYAFGADYVDRVVADGDFTVVDSEVTVLGDLTVDGDVTAMNDTLMRSVKGDITVKQPLPAKATVIQDVTAAGDALCVFGIGDPITVLEADLEGRVTKNFEGGEEKDMLYAYLAPLGSSPKTVGAYQITKAKNFVFGTTSCTSPEFIPEKLYEAFPGTDTSRLLAYTAKDDGFVTVEVNSKPSYGGIALTVDFKGAEAGAKFCHSFEQGWHRSAWNPQVWEVYKEDSKEQSKRPPFNREYVFAMRRGETMHLRAFRRRISREVS